MTGTPQSQFAHLNKSSPVMDQINPGTSSISPLRRRAAFGVHILTALGAGLALVALLEAAQATS